MRPRRTLTTLPAAAAALLLAVGPLHAQDQDEDEEAAATEATETTDEDQAMEEIVVTVDRRTGDPVDVDALRLEQLRQQVINDFAEAQAEQEREAWRQGMQTSIRNPDSRIAWGYDAQSEAAMRRSAMNDLPIDQVQPATVISVSF